MLSQANIRQIPANTRRFIIFQNIKKVQNKQKARKSWKKQIKDKITIKTA